MTSLASRVKGIFYITISLLIFFSILGLFTYYQVQKNEEYQNRLQFRELSAVAQDLENGSMQMVEAIDAYVGRKIVDGSTLFRSATGALKEGKLHDHAIENCQPNTVCVGQFDEVGSTDIEASVSRSGEKNNVENPFSITVPFRHFLTTHITHHAAILVVNDKGDVLIRQNNIKPDAGAASLTFHNVKDILLSSDQGPVTTSGFIEQRVAEKNYRFYFMPWTSQSVPLTQSIKTDMNVVKANVQEGGEGNVQEDDEKKGASTALLSQFYIIGVKSVSQLQKEKLRIPNTIAAFVLLFVFMLLSLLPLMKIRLISAAQSLTLVDRKAAIYGVIIFIAFGHIFVLFAISTFLESSKIKEEGVNIANGMKASFRQELKAILGEATDVIRSQSPTLSSDEISDNLLYPPDSKPWSVDTQNWLESVFFLDSEGVSAGDMRSVYWSDRSFFRNEQCAKDLTKEKCLVEKENGLSLEDRIYFQRARSCEVWPMSPRLAVINSLKVFEPDLCPGLFLQRIFNKRDSRLSTQFSARLTTGELSMINTVAEETHRSKNSPNILAPFHVARSFFKTLSIDLERSSSQVVSFGSKFRTFFAPVLTPGYGFIVFDNHTGQVLFHNQKDRVLNENIFVQTDNNPVLMELARTQKSEAAAIQTVYRGREHIFVVSDLTDGLPWSLAVTQDLTNQRALFFLRMFTIVAYFLVSMMMLILVYELIERIYRSRHHGLLFNTKYQMIQRLGLGEYHSATHGRLFIATAGSLIVVVITVFYFSSSMQYMSALSHIFADASHQQLHQSQDEIHEYTQQMLGNNERHFSHQPFIFSSAIQKNSDGVCKDIVSAENTPDDWAYFPVLSPSLYFSLLSFSQTRVPLYEKLLALEFTLNDAASKPPAPKISHPSQSAPCTFSLLNVGEGKTHVFGYVVLSFLCGVLFLLISLPLVHNLFIRRVLGLHIPLHFRMKMPPLSSETFGRLSIAIRQTELQQFSWHGSPDLHYLGRFYIGGFLFDRGTNTASCTLAQHIAHGRSYVLKKLAEIEKQTGYQGNGAKRIVIYGIEDVAFNRDERLMSLAALTLLSEQTSLHLVLECEVAPLYRLTQQQYYASRCGEKQNADSTEVYGWSQLLAKFEKHYAWAPQHKCRPYHKQDSWACLANESAGWPELMAIRERFSEYLHLCHDDPNGDAAALGQTKQQEAHWVKTYWQADQIIEYFSAEAGALYRKRWELCTRQERLMLYQIARGDQPNPANLIPLEHLVRRGYLFRDADWFIVNESFRLFVLGAESPERMSQWLAEAQDSTWRYFRVPLFILLITSVAILVYVTTDSIQSFLAILSAVLGILPLALSNLNLVKGGTGDDTPAGE